jgi:hypothetical protein
MKVELTADDLALLMIELGFAMSEKTSFTWLTKLA